MKKIFSFITIFLLLSSLVSTVFADGMIHISDNDMWSLFNEEKQFCAINHKNGYQYMILTVDTGQELKGDKAVWIFPVPAKPESVAIKIIKGFPTLRGYDVEERVDKSISEVFAAMRFTQIYPVPFVFTLAQFGASGDFSRGITIYEHIEKMGLITELVSAADSYSLANYIASKGLNLPEASQYVLREYTGQEYSLVISWISDIEKFKQEQGEMRAGYREMWTGNAMGVFISFPTEKIYYPLKPTSVYGNKRVPAVIYVLDYVTPELYDGIEADAETNYFFESGSIYSEELRDFFAGYEKEPIMVRSETGETPSFTINNLEYTKIKINSPSKYLTQDLWIEAIPPLKIKAIDFSNKYGFIFGLAFFILCSCLASLFSGIIIFKDTGSKSKLFLFGLWNFLTLIGFSIAAYINAREIQQNNASFRKILIITLLITAIIPIIALLLFTNLFRYWDFDEIEFILIGYAIIYAFISPFVWGYYNNRKILKFTFLFSLIFIVLTIVFQKVLTLIL